MRRAAVATLTEAAHDPSREPRVQVAKGITDVSVLAALTGDDDPLVRAAALEAAERVGHPASLSDLAAGLLGGPAWQVRVGVAKALTDPDS
ncbi:HEAT repeat domain-containing protein [Lentzea sp. NPDC055074]